MQGQKKKENCSFQIRNAQEKLKDDLYQSVYLGTTTMAASPKDAQHAVMLRATNLHLATLGFKKVRPSRCTSFTPSFRSRVWLLLGSPRRSRHSSTVAAAKDSTCSQFGGSISPPPRTPKGSACIQCL